MQRFYITKDMSLTYCGAVRNFFYTDPNINGTVQILLESQSASATQLVWCYPNVCSFLQWTMTLTAPNVLEFHVVLSSPGE